MKVHVQRIGRIESRSPNPRRSQVLKGLPVALTGLATGICFRKIMEHRPTDRRDEWLLRFFGGIAGWFIIEQVLLYLLGFNAAIVAALAGTLVIFWRLRVVGGKTAAA